jgi:ubiquinone/menaquinone biosynthesis C-methylase UbiE
MNKNRKWLSYNNLAWTEPIICPPEECHEEVESLSKTIINNSKIRPKTLLHLGSGAGIYDYTFKRHFNVTGVDISDGMLKIAKKLNPEVKYVRGDMREIRLKPRFDAVVIPDSIGYMTTIKDLRKAINTAYNHLKNGGILLIVSQMRDDFKENNFVYKGSKKDIKITIFENNCITNKTSYEATIVYLIRRMSKLKIYTDKHTIGLFNSETWNKLLKESGFNIKTIKAKNTYDRFMSQDGDYPRVIFICRKIK